jgi:hypothetical protein
MQNKYDREQEDEHRRWREEREPSQSSANEEDQRYGRAVRSGRIGEPHPTPDYSRRPYAREWRSEREPRGMGSAGRDYSAGHDYSGARRESRDTSEYRYWSGRDDAGYRPGYERYPREDQRSFERPQDERGFYGERRERLWTRDPSSGALYGYEYPRPGYQGVNPSGPTGERWPSESSSSWRESDRERAFGPSSAAERYQRLTGHAGKGPKGYVRSDERIREDVCDRLSDDDEVDASEVSVSVKEGEVVLEGTVADRYSKHRAEDIAESVSGVRDVSNHLRTRKNFIQELGDKLTGDDDTQHQGHSGSGTRNAPSGPAPRSSQSH